MQKLGIIGSGSMGNGIAQTAAQKGYDVVLVAHRQVSLEKAQKSITGSLQKRVDKGKMAVEDMNAALAKIDFTLEMDKVADCDIVIEAIAEIIEEKIKVFTKLEEICRPDAILATNTSSLSLTDIAAAMKDNTRLVGIHFFNPVPAMKLVEIVKTETVSEDVLAAAKAFAESLGKTTITAKDTPGFVVNYLQYPFRLNAMRMYGAGIASAEDIDTAAKLGLGHPMGPLELQDMVGLDITYNATKSIYEKTHEPWIQPPQILEDMVKAGKLGRKTGEGFYKYDK
ncbi:MAG: 3-hydroxyacyl-CoA dehydrogenase family protein [Lachnospiraceae bacterium]|nr:3-hydroxyacyl-CoA dehydrogenase family protein [Lachnospiraceae bacterium]